MLRTVDSDCVANYTENQERKREYQTRHASTIRLRNNEAKVFLSRVLQHVVFRARLLNSLVPIE